MIISVNSFEEAKSYPVLYNNSEIMLDNNRDVFYLKSVDAMGKYTISTYEFHQIENEKPLNTNDIVTKEQFNALSNKLDVLLASIGGTNNGEQYPKQNEPAQDGQPNTATKRRGS